MLLCSTVLVVVSIWWFWYVCSVKKNGFIPEIYFSTAWYEDSRHVTFQLATSSFSKDSSDSMPAATQRPTLYSSSSVPDVNLIALSAAVATKAVA
jgi:hypothetical protein